ncbi:hypothetical protein [Phaffia rhodozyma]|uniref:Uncharacterized protein n=1 Tax=Phaffia rhodozyma TaxID=264483 RepID=A0A0F7SEG6_PHARH|nr:hypothetical protein [Phaffia rhodozyma]
MPASRMVSSYPFLPLGFICSPFSTFSYPFKLSVCLFSSLLIVLTYPSLSVCSLQYCLFFSSFSTLRPVVTLTASSHAKSLFLHSSPINRSSGSRKIRRATGLLPLPLHSIHPIPRPHLVQHLV